MQKSKKDQEIVERTIERIEASYSRIVKGKANIDDYYRLNITNVENVEWLNTEIKEGKDIKLSYETEPGRLERLGMEIVKFIENGEN